MKSALLVFPVLVLAACSASNSEVRDGSDAAATRSFEATGFDGVSLAGSDNVRVVRGDSFSVVATGPGRVLDELEVDVKDGVLKVGRKRSDKWKIGWPGTDGTSGNAIVTVTMPAIRKASVAGSGDMTVDRADTDAFRATVAGSGNLGIAALVSKGAKFSVAGSGNLVVAGTAETIDISVAGSGDVDAAKLAGQTLDVSTAGSGNVSASASGSAKVSIVGSGNVRIAGTTDCKISKMGSGEVSCTG